jgi:hypothetical protein
MILVTANLLGFRSLTTAERRIVYAIGFRRMTKKPGGSGSGSKVPLRRDLS